MTLGRDKRGWQGLMLISLIFFSLFSLLRALKKKKKSIFPGPRESESLSPSVPTAPR